MELRRTRRSFYYLAGYLLTGGLGFLFMPAMSLKLFLSNGDYDLVMVRFVGVMLLGLGIFVVQLIRHKVYVLYPSTLMVRSVILAALVWFYIISKDPMMLVLTGIVGLGFVLTFSSLLMDRKKAD